MKLSIVTRESLSPLAIVMVGERVYLNLRESGRITNVKTVLFWMSLHMPELEIVISMDVVLLGSLATAPMR